MNITMVIFKILFLKTLASWIFKTIFGNGFLERPGWPVFVSFDIIEKYVKNMLKYS